MTTRNLDYFFKPRSIALVGVGRDSEVLVARNLINAGFKGPVLPVNTTRQALEGILAYPDVASLPLVPDLAVITSPLRDVPALIDQLGERGTRAAVIISEGHEVPEQGSEREALYQAILEAARPHLLRLLGPGSLGLSVLAMGVNASLGQYRPQTGRLAFVTQSSAIARAALDWNVHLGIGLSHLISLGAAIDVDFADILDYLTSDHRTRAILLYLEQIDDPRKFLSATRRAARIKPVIVLKPHRYTPGDASDAVYDAAFRRAGILRVNDHHELFNVVETLTAVKSVGNDRLAILSNSHSLGLLATDTLGHFGGRLAEFAEETENGLVTLVDPVGSPANPVDLGDQAGAEVYGKALDLMLKDPGVDGVLVINAPSALREALPIADAIIERLSSTQRCLLASFVGPGAGEAARRRTTEHGIPTYDTSHEAVQAFMRLVQHKRNQALLMETPPSLPEAFTPDTETARQIIAQTLAAGRHRLNEYEAMQLLAAYGIPVVETQIASGPEQAAAIAARLDRSVALKIISPDVVYKSEVGGVVLFLDSSEAVQQAANAMLVRLRQAVPEARIDGFLIQPMEREGRAYEMTVGVCSGGPFGPVLYFGQGGTEATVIRDIAYGLPPLNMHLAREMMSRTRIYSLLRGSPLRCADLDALALTLIKVSQMVIDLGEIVELEINPLWASDQGVLALDARVEVTEFEGWPAERLAIHPYPKELEECFTLPDGRSLLLRPILPEDEPALQAQVRRMPPEDLRLRFFQPIRELSHDMAARMSQIDYNNEMALVIVGPGRAGEAEIYGVVRLIIDPDNERAEYSLLLERHLTGHGLGPLLMRRIIDYAQQRGIREIYGEVLQENQPMLALNKALGFNIQVHPEDPGLRYVTLELNLLEDTGAYDDK